ncbi:hypothetical protein [Streptomyces sp. WZ-12]|uniref:hypothetical protein n=1 Tax=Streptomyces sp. WZ-12 TaxID=3030210 RepID=UPI0023815490|nr:hypothetical protein [Streptomyces sp. WZ-12]
MRNMDSVAAELRSARERGAGAIETAQLARDLLQNGFGVISFVAAFHKAFGIPLNILQKAQAWQGFGWGGLAISDEDFEKTLSPWFTP